MRYTETENNAIVIDVVSCVKRMDLYLFCKTDGPRQFAVKYYTISRKHRYSV